MDEPEHIPPHDPLTELKGALTSLRIVTVVLVLALVAVVVFVWVSSTIQRNEIRRVAEQTNTALCTLRDDLQHRIDDSRKFLRDHPNGIQGITPEDIQRSIDGQQSTINALAILDCDAGP